MIAEGFAGGEGWGIGGWGLRARWVRFRCLATRAWGHEEHRGGREYRGRIKKRGEDRWVRFFRGVWREHAGTFCGALWRGEADRQTRRRRGGGFVFPGR